MTVKRKTVKRSITVPRGTISRITYTPPKLPDSPSVIEGPRSYGLSKRGRHIVPRFYVTNIWGYRKYKRWWVMDTEDSGVARKTEKDGYDSKKEAVKRAKHHRDKYGAWATLPF